MARRTINVGWGYIRGFARPKYTVVETPVTPVAKKSVDTIAREVIRGMWGNGAARKSALTKAGYDYNAVQKKVDELCSGSDTALKKSVAAIAKEVVAGKWGNGTARTNALKNAGYDPVAVQTEVNKLCQKSVDAIAKEVLAGKWGNGAARKSALIKAGYDYNLVQKRVNELA